MLLIVEIVPYVAFLGAAALVGWVGFDVFREKRRKAPLIEAQDSGRGLAGPPRPMTEEPPEEEDPSEDEPVLIAPPLELVLPSSHAVDVASEPEQCENEATESDEVEASPEPESELAPEAEDNLDSDETVILVRRDPSVRVFDTAVAASERKVAS
ncbi:MAG: hypothetical protein K8I27_16705 [Planctomycetes bacterium]|nr:hypothetical protein [Planctomycetota bacterium]